MIRTRRVALAQSVKRFSLRQTRSVCAEIMLKQRGFPCRSFVREPGSRYLAFDAIRQMFLKRVLLRQRASTNEGHHPMRFFVCFGFLLAATAAQAQTYTTVVNGNTKTVTTTGPTATATTVQTSSSGSTRTYTTTITKNGGGYQPMGGSGYNPMGR